MEYLYGDAIGLSNEIIPQSSSWDKLMFSLIYGAVKDILVYIHTNKNTQIYNFLSYKERRSKLKELYKIKRRSEKACMWLSEEGIKKRGNTIPYIGFGEACTYLNFKEEKVRRGIKILLKQAIEEEKNNLTIGE